MNLNLLIQIMWGICHLTALACLVYQIVIININNNDHRNRFLAFYISVFGVMIFDSLIFFTLNSYLYIQACFSILLMLSLCSITITIPSYSEYRWQIFLLPNAGRFFRYAAFVLVLCYILYPIIVFIFDDGNLEKAKLWLYFLYLSTHILLILAILYSFISLLKAKAKSPADRRELKYWKYFALTGLVILPLLLVFHWLYGLFPFVYNHFSYNTGVIFQQIFYLLFIFMCSVIVHNFIQVKPQPYGLTAREQEIAQYLIKGQTYNTIADKLCISLSTVQTHVRRIYEKTKCRNKTQLAIKIELH